MKPWDPISSTSGPAETDLHFVIGWTQQVSTGNISHFISFEGNETTGKESDFSNLKARLLCHFLLNAMPDEALPELSESLIGMFDFYKRRDIGLGKTRQLLARFEIPASMGESTERPVFQIDEE